MNVDPANNQNSRSVNDPSVQWDIDRYLLSDPSLDREAFERRMLDDFALAEMVASSVANLQVISSAARGSADSAVTLASQISVQNDRGTYRWAIQVSAAALLMAVSAWQFRSMSNDDQLSLIAKNWVAFENLTTIESLESIANGDQPNENQPDVESSEQSDWLVEAAREFYLVSNDGGAG